MKVRDVMSPHVVEIFPEATCQEAAQTMRDRDIGMLVVTQDSHIIEGVLTDRDLVTRCMALGADPAERRVLEYMDRHPTTVDADLDLERAVEIMRNSCHHRLPVTFAGCQVVGLIALDDVAIDLKHYTDAFLEAACQYSDRNP